MSNYQQLNLGNIQVKTRKNGTDPTFLAIYKSEDKITFCFGRGSQEESNIVFKDKNLNEEVGEFDQVYMYECSLYQATQLMGIFVSSYLGNPSILLDVLKMIDDINKSNDFYKVNFAAGFPNLKRDRLFMRVKKVMDIHLYDLT